MKFRQYLIQEHKKAKLMEELVQGGLLKMFKEIEYWFDFSDASVNERTKRLESWLVNAGGVHKFQMLVKRIPSVSNFLVRHADQLEGALGVVARSTREKQRLAKRQSKQSFKKKPKGVGMSADYARRRKMKSALLDIAPKDRWWENDPEELIDHVYWLKGDLPPSKFDGGDSYLRNWNMLVDQLSKKFPPPSDWVNPMPPKEKYELSKREKEIKELMRRRSER